MFNVGSKKHVFLKFCWLLKVLKTSGRLVGQNPQTFMCIRLDGAELLRKRRQHSRLLSLRLSKLEHKAMRRTFGCLAGCVCLRLSGQNKVHKQKLFGRPADGSGRKFVRMKLWRFLGVFSMYLR